MRLSCDDNKIMWCEVKIVLAWILLCNQTNKTIQKANTETKLKWEFCVVKS